MEEVFDQEFRGEAIAIDSKRYIRCRFIDCTIVFNGGEGEALGCTFVNCGCLLGPVAIRTVHYLGSIAAGGGAELVAQFGLNYAGAPLRFEEQTMTEKKQPDLVVDNCDISDNRGAALRLEGDATAHVSNTAMRRNAAGVVKKGNKKKWHEGPLGVGGIGLLVTIAGGATLYWLGFV